MATILVIDDNPEVQFLFQKVLTRLGHRYVSARNGKEGIELARNNKPSLLFVDLWMPEVDGVDVVRKLRGEGVAQPIVAITADTVTSEHIPLDAGADCLYHKPLSVVQIQEILALYLGPRPTA